MELLTMYPAQANSPETTLAGAISTSGTSITVLDGSVLPDAPNILTIGAEYSTAETVLMTAKSGNTLTVTRGYNGTTPRAWDKGDTIGRYFTGADHDAMRENIDSLNDGKPDKVSNGTAGNFAGLDSEGGITDSGKKAGDFAAATHSHNGYANKVASPTSGNFAGLNASGDLTDSGKKAGDFAAASHTHNGYANKVASPTSGNFAGLNASGDLTDSGKKAGDFAAATHSHSGYAQLLTFANKTVSVSSWASSSTYANYPYAAAISCSGVTADYVADVVFSPDDADGGNFAPVALTGSGTVTIYAVEKPTSTVTIPTIKCEKAV